MFRVSTGEQYYESPGDSDCFPRELVRLADALFEEYGPDIANDVLDSYLEAGDPAIMPFAELLADSDTEEDKPANWPNHPSLF